MPVEQGTEFGIIHIFLECKLHGFMEWSRVRIYYITLVQESQQKTNVEHMRGVLELEYFFYYLHNELVCSTTVLSTPKNFNFRCHKSSPRSFGCARRFQQDLR